ncbi:uncharacterized protein LOC117522184 [Thalassophryne amazonica]|uniref:uncharacterized protein LOC117522184 n=1 Tax=Thalassophryne amazonica TaxID=390379 RepID=UPI001470A1BA|nr:uncharacterized protein LOC117522184 [Thalassophryne amazonica]
MLQQLVIKEEMLPEQQELNLSVDQRDIKQEQEEVWTSNEGQQLHRLETEKTKLHFVPVKTENDDEIPQSSQVLQNSDMLQQLVIKEEILPEQQELNLSVDQKDIKQEQEEVWTSNEGQQLHRLETEKTKLHFVPVKTENDDEIPQSSQVLQNSVQQSFRHQTSSEMDLREEMHQLLDEDRADILKAAVCLLAAAVVVKTRARTRRVRCERKRKVVWVRELLLNRHKYDMYEKLMKHLREGNVKSFRNFVRMDPEMFGQMVEDLTPMLQKNTSICRKPLFPGLKLAITLRYLATGDSYKSLAYEFRVTHSTIVSVVSEVCQAIYDHYHEMAFMCPTTEEEWKEVAQGFSDKWDFHHCCGSIDGKHVRVLAPPHSCSLYYNYKGFYSIITLALVDANYKFRYVDVGAYGADSDVGAFRDCGLYHALDQDKAGLPTSEPLPGDDTDVPYFLVGNDAFSLRSWMMKPYSKRHLTAAERIFNYRLSRAHRIVENAFGILANRFRCLHSCMIQGPQTVTKIVLAACTLHNLLADKNPATMQQAADWEDLLTHEVQPGLWRQQDQENPLHGIQRQIGNTATIDGKRVRDYLTEYYNSVGAVPWQNRRVGLQNGVDAHSEC